jgi:hypothetical protein
MQKQKIGGKLLWHISFLMNVWHAALVLTLALLALSQWTMQRAFT